MNTPEKCPKCGVSDVCVHDDLKIYACGTLVNAYGRFFHTGTCQAFVELRKPLDLERYQLAERVKRLEEVGDKMAAAFDKEWLGDADIECIQDDWDEAKGQP